VTPKEALEHVRGIAAVEAIRSAKSEDAWRSRLPPELRARLPVRSSVLTDTKSQQLADTPHLTGDPEWDAIELAETDPSKEPLRIVR